MNREDNCRHEKLFSLYIYIFKKSSCSIDRVFWRKESLFPHVDLELCVLCLCSQTLLPEGLEYRCLCFHCCPAALYKTQLFALTGCGLKHTHKVGLLYFCLWEDILNKPNLKLLMHWKSLNSTDFLYRVPECKET